MSSSLPRRVLLSRAAAAVAMTAAPVAIDPLAIAATEIGGDGLMAVLCSGFACAMDKQDAFNRGMIPPGLSDEEQEELLSAINKEFDHFMECLSETPAVSAEQLYVKAALTRRMLERRHEERIAPSLYETDLILSVLRDVDAALAMGVLT